MEMTNQGGTISDKEVVDLPNLENKVESVKDDSNLICIDNNQKPVKSPVFQNEVDSSKSDENKTNDNNVIDTINNSNVESFQKEEEKLEDTSLTEDKCGEPMDIDLTLDDEEQSMDSESTSKEVDNENVKHNDEKPEKSANVIDLDDSDSDSVITIVPTVPRKKTDCINPDCLGYNEHLLKASGYCLSFYRVKYNQKGTQMVCKECRDLCLNNFQIMTDLAVDNEPLFKHKLPLQSDCVEINDSDEEDEDTNKLKINDKDFEILKLEIDQSIADVYKKYNIDSQVKENVQILTSEYEKITDGTDELSKLFTDLQTRIDNVRNQIYENKPSTHEIQGVDIDSTGAVHFRNKVAERRSSRKIQKPATYNEADFNTNSRIPENDAIKKPLPPQVSQIMEPPRIAPVKLPFIPKFGPLTREPPKINESYYAMKSAAFGAWTLCRMLEVFPTGMIINDKVTETVTYRVSFENPNRRVTKTMIKLITGKQLAYSKPADVRLPIGSRVIALFNESENVNNQNNYYAGVVAEPLTATNRFRYLIFFDDGYAQYVHHDNVFLIADVSPNVWEDIPLESRNYIQQYLKEYPDRPMVKLTTGQVLRTERNGKWWAAKVIEVDGSLVKMNFEDDNRREWIYRGSRRLAPLFYSNHGLVRQSKGYTTPQRKIPSSIYKRANEPYVEYTRTTETDDDIVSINNTTRAVARKSTSPNVATKSTTQANVPIVPFLPTNKVPPGSSRVIYYTTRTGKLPGLYKHHQCGPLCREKSQRSLAELRDYSILAKPILAGWFRETVRYGKNKKEIRYITPCLRIVRNMQELHRYLRITHSEMSVDMFDFNYCIHVLTLYSIEKCIIEKKDLSEGTEFTPISVVNDIDGTLPEYMRYTNKREATEGVHLNLDEEFLCGCDCTDDCQDKTKCACWQLTIQGSKVGKHASPDMSTGYIYKRLMDPVVTGIYECNSRCKCNKNTCLNRVVQHPLQLKLQIFKTPNRGWGIRCLHDVPRGSFICIYAGQLLTEQTANEGGINFGDEYLAELDYIEVAERLKEGYESDVHEDDIETAYEDKKDDDDEDYDPEASADDRDYTCSLPKIQLASECSIRTRRSKRRSTQIDDSENSNQSTDTDKKESNKKIDDKMSDNISTTASNTSSVRSEDEKKKDSGDNSGEDESITISDEETVRQPSSFIPTAAIEKDADEYVPKHKSVRKMFGRDESCYIMDAKNAGNIGRFLNHSCSPNVFVQNVFVDTHDLRFPWVAFFAMSHVRAGIELTWNYNYDVGSVPGKVMYCHCGSEECRGRLL